MVERSLLPQFVLEALEDPSQDASGVQSRIADVERDLGALLEAASLEVASAPSTSRPEAGPSAAVLERLEASIEQPPHRYAPFFRHLAELFDLPEAAAIAELARLAEPKVWHFAGLPGVHRVTVDGGPRIRSAETLFVRFAPGLRFPQHRHTGLERVLVLEGSYRDSAGVVHRAGELREWAEGTEHGFRVERAGPCIIASVVFGRRFSAWPLRVLDSVLGR